MKTRQAMRFLFTPDIIEVNGLKTKTAGTQSVPQSLQQRLEVVAGENNHQQVTQPYEAP